MIKINLLPEERRRVEFPAYKFFLAGTYIIIGFTIVLWAYSLGMYKYTENRLEEVNAGISSMHVWQERYELNQAQNAEIKKRDTILQGKSKERLLWSHSLAELGNITPYGCWLLSVGQDKANAADITIRGKALKMDGILQFIDHLQREPYIESVELLETKRSTAGNAAASAAAIEFSLKIRHNGVVKK